ncbi:MAG: helix-turn-helix domain-containing protein [Nitrosomonas sp.]|nr:helix-turn-helix domain-containing protein [Nitrosomonas sp.]
MRKSLEKAIEIAGGQTALANLIDITPQAVQQWVKRGHVSRKSAKPVSRATGIPLENL